MKKSGKSREKKKSRKKSGKQSTKRKFELPLPPWFLNPVHFSSELLQCRHQTSHAATTSESEKDWKQEELFVLSMSMPVAQLGRFSTFNILFRAVISPLKVLRLRLLKFSLSSCVQIMSSTKKSFERLPTNLVPKNYALTLQPNLTEFSFTGKEVIEVEVSIRIFHFFSTQTHSYSHIFFSEW